MRTAHRKDNNDKQAISLSLTSAEMITFDPIVVPKPLSHTQTSALSFGFPCQLGVWPLVSMLNKAQSPSSWSIHIEQCLKCGDTMTQSIHIHIRHFSAQVSRIRRRSPIQTYRDPRYVITERAPNLWPNNPYGPRRGNKASARPNVKMNLALGKNVQLQLQSAEKSIWMQALWMYSRLSRAACGDSKVPIARHVHWTMPGKFDECTKHELPFAAATVYVSLIHEPRAIVLFAFEHSLFGNMQISCSHHSGMQLTFFRHFSPPFIVVHVFFIIPQ